MVQVLQRDSLLPVLLLLVLHFTMSFSSSSLGSSSSEEATEGEWPVVRVAQGALRGHRIQREQGAPVREVYAFEGVPYARAPTGSRRFKDPEEAVPWTGVRNATTFGSNCIQKNSVTLNVTGEEDCLFLNIYTADPPSRWNTHKRPVIVYIHGGSFTQWSGDMKIRTPDPLLHHGLVFVSFNYRLGVMGFLSTQDSNAPGNGALKDQVMAMRWVQTNIAAFGGDSTQVTLMGESAGAGSVHYHLLSPLSRGLFQRAISVSGKVIPKWALVLDPRGSAVALRRRWSASCPLDKEEDIVPCLQRIDASELVFNQYDVPLEKYQNYFAKNTFRPCVEAPGSATAPFLSANPEQLLKEGRFLKVPYIIGFTSAEGILYLGFGRLLRNSSRWIEIEENFEEIFRWEMPLGVPKTRQMAREVRNFYLGNRTLSDANENLDTLERFVQMCTDINYAEGTVHSARLMAEKGAEIYVYQFSRDGPLGLLKIALNATRIPGVAHGDDMVYVFDSLKNGRLREIPVSEQSIRERQAKIFANFAKTGNPTPPGSDLTHWPLFTPQQESYIDMNGDLRVHEHALGDRMVFWRNLMTSPTE